MPDLKPAQQIYSSLSEELSGEYEVEQFYVESKTTLESLADKITAFDPTAVVMMNNPTVGLYRRYQAAQPQGTEFPPAIAVMVSFLEKELQGLQNATGIFFEIPSTTAFVNMRQISRNPIEKVGVLVRETFDFIEAQAKLAAPEQFEIVTRKVREGSTIRDIRLGLRQLIRDEGVDALWVSMITSCSPNGRLSKDGYQRQDGISKNYRSSLAWNFWHPKTYASAPTQSFRTSKRLAYRRRTYSSISKRTIGKPVNGPPRCLWRSSSSSTSILSLQMPW